MTWTKKETTEMMTLMKATDDMKHISKLLNRPKKEIWEKFLDTIIKMIAKGESKDELCATYNIDPELVQVPEYVTATNRGKKWTAEEHNLMLELRKDGKTIPEISTQLGRTTKAITMRLEQFVKPGDSADRQLVKDLQTMSEEDLCEKYGRSWDQITEQLETICADMIKFGVDPKKARRITKVTKYDDDWFNFEE